MANDRWFEFRSLTSNRKQTYTRDYKSQIIVRTSSIYCFAFSNIVTRYTNVWFMTFETQSSDCFLFHERSRLKQTFNCEIEKQIFYKTNCNNVYDSCLQLFMRKIVLHWKVWLFFPHDFISLLKRIRRYFDESSVFYPTKL